MGTSHKLRKNVTRYGRKPQRRGAYQIAVGAETMALRMDRSCPPMHLLLAQNVKRKHDKK